MWKKSSRILVKNIKLILYRHLPKTGYTVFKVRIKNSDIQRGKRSGYRMVYYLKTPETVLLITIYSKTEQDDVSAAQIRRIITEHESQVHTRRE
jgi:mRNA-degrading endonuclease RelE of RelBE toxin-antitoxin system